MEVNNETCRRSQASEHSRSCLRRKRSHPYGLQCSLAWYLLVAACFHVGTFERASISDWDLGRVGMCKILLKASTNPTVALPKPSVSRLSSLHGGGQEHTMLDAWGDGISANRAIATTAQQATATAMDVRTQCMEQGSQIVVDRPQNPTRVSLLAHGRNTNSQQRLRACASCTRAKRKCNGKHISCESSVRSRQTNICGDEDGSTSDGLSTQRDTLAAARAAHPELSHAATAAAYEVGMLFELAKNAIQMQIHERTQLHAVNHQKCAVSLPSTIS